MLFQGHNKITVLLKHTITF